MSIPILSKAFFRDHPPEASLFKKWKDLYGWKKSIIPIYEWGDIIYIGCLQVPSDFPTDSVEAVFCFCDSESLLSTWEQYNEEVETSSEKPSDGDFFGALESSLSAEGIQISSTDESEEPRVPEEEVTETLEGLEESPAIEMKNKGKAFSGKVGEIFLHLASHFQKSMLLLQTKNGIVPFQWDEGFSTEKNVPEETISLEVRSPFRIVNQTQKPYHGYVVSNEITNHFFHKWNQGQIPEHLTLVPVLVENEVLGMILCLGDKNTDTTENLFLAESAASDLADFLISSGLSTSDFAAAS